MRKTATFAVLAYAGLCLAQSNAIFISGSDDGYARSGFAQPFTTPGIFSSGQGDGYARSSAAQSVTTAGIFTSGAGDGYARTGAVQAITTAGIFSGGTGDGYARNGVSQPSTTVGIFTSGMGDGYARDAVSQPITTVGIYKSGPGDGYARSDGNNLLVSVNASVLLEGPVVPGSGLMSDALRTAGLVPLTEPYSALGSTQAAGGGGETTTAGILSAGGVDAVVDWVRLELRNPASPATVVATRQALLTRSGSVIDAATGSPDIRFNVSPGNYHLVIRHRNHLGVMTAAAITFTDTPTAVDLISGVTATFGTAAQKTINGVNTLWAGDVTGNHQLKYTGSGNDRDPILVSVGSTTPNNILTNQYSARDVNMDGTVKYTGSANDRDPILVNVGSTTPNNIRVEQLP